MSEATALYRPRNTPWSVRGRFSHRPNCREPIEVTHLSISANNVASGFPVRLTSSSRLRRVAASIVKASVRSSTLSPRIWGTAAFCVSRTYCRSAPAALIASGNSSAPKPFRSSVPSWSVSNREALASSKYQGGRVRVAVPVRPTSSVRAFSDINSSAGLSRSSCAAREVRPPSDCRTVKRPAARSSQARPNRSPSKATAATRVSRRSSNNASSVTVPGVMTRTTSRCTGPLDLAGSPNCSQIATLSPLRTSLAR